MNYAFYVKQNIPFYVSFTANRLPLVTVIITFYFKLCRFFRLTLMIIRRIYIYILLPSILTMTSRTPKQDRLKSLDVLNPHPERVKATVFDINTFFDPCDIVQVKYEMLRRVHIDGASKSDAATEFGVTRPTFYQAARDFDSAGLAGLVPKRRGPKGAHKLTDTLMRFIDQQLQKQPLSAVELADQVQQHFSISIHPRSIERALEKKKKRCTP